MKRFWFFIFILALGISFLRCGKDKPKNPKNDFKTQADIDEKKSHNIKPKVVKLYEKLSKSAKIFFGKWKVVNPKYPDNVLEWTFKNNGDIITKGMGMIISGKYNIRKNNLFIKINQGNIIYNYQKQSDKIILSGKLNNQTEKFILTKILK